MNIQREKLKVLCDGRTTSKDWWELISEAEKISIDRGIRDIETGNTMQHQDILKKYDSGL